MNIKKIQNKLIQEGLEAILITSSPNRQYATGFASSAGILIVTQTAAEFYTDSRYIEAARAAIDDADVYPISGGYVKQTAAIVEKYGIKNLGIEEERMGYMEYMGYKEAVRAELVPAQKIMRKLREVKEPYEIEKLIAAQRVAEKALEDVLGEIHIGMTEKELAAEINYRIMKNGGDGNSFSTISICGTRTSMPHGVPTDARLASGDFVTMDFGCRLNGYCSDMTRTIALGSVTDEMKKVYYTVLEAQLAGIEAAKPGVTGREIHMAAHNVIAKAGYGEYFGHGFGHGVGIEIHEFPNANMANNEPMPVGAAISAEPGIYLPERFGVRIEDVLVITENGNDDIMRTPKELLIL